MPNNPNQVPNRLSAEQMVGVAETFQSAYDHVMRKYVGSTHLADITKFMYNLVAVQQMHMTMSETGRQDIAETIFSNGNGVLAEFFMQLSFTFYGRLGGDDEVNGLIGNLARAASVPQPRSVGVVGANAVKVLMPHQHTDRMSQQDNLEQALQANPWLVAVGCANLFLSLPASSGK